MYSNFAIASFNRVLVVFGLGLLTVLAGRAEAATYTYVGADYTSANAPYTTSMSLNLTMSLSITLGANLTDFSVLSSIVSLSVDDGLATYDETDQIALKVGTDGSGQIIGWLMSFHNATFTAGTSSESANCGAVIDPGECPFGPGDNAFDAGSGFASNEIDGTWTPVPEPSTAMLVGFGIALLGRKRGNRPTHIPGESCSNSIERIPQYLGHAAQ